MTQNSTLNLFALFHLNLAFSSIEEEQRAQRRRFGGAFHLYELLPGIDGDDFLRRGAVSRASALCLGVVDSGDRRPRMG